MGEQERGQDRHQDDLQTEHWRGERNVAPFNRQVIEQLREQGDRHVPPGFRVAVGKHVQCQSLANGRENRDAERGDQAVPRPFT